MQIVMRMFLFIMFMSFAVVAEVNAFVTGAWDVAGSQSITVKIKGAKKAHTDKLPQVLDLFVFGSDGDFSAQGLDGIGLWRQKGKSFKVKVDDPGVMETFFEDGFESSVPPIIADVTVKSFSVSGSSSKGRMKGTMTFKINIDLLNGTYMYVTTTYKFTGSPAVENIAGGASRAEQREGFSELIRQVIREVAPELAAAAGN